MAGLCMINITEFEKQGMALFQSQHDMPETKRISLQYLHPVKCTFNLSGRINGVNLYRDYFMVGERVRFLFTSCGESQTNERGLERVSL